MSYKVLVVDDARRVGEYMGKALRRAGYQITDKANDGREAVESYRRSKPDLVLMDVNMPQLDGVEAMKEILKEDPEAKILVVTALSQPILNREMMRMGAKGVLSKPVRLWELIRVVDGLLKGTPHAGPC